MQLCNCATAQLRNLATTITLLEIYMKKNLCPLLCVIMLTLLWSADICPAETNEAWAKQTQNPVADLISVPFQRNSSDIPHGGF